jgi:hypothetical protein
MSEEVWSQAQRAKDVGKTTRFNVPGKITCTKEETQMNRNINGQRETQMPTKIHSNNKTDKQARTKQKRAKQTIYNPILTTKLETGATN